MSLRIVFAGTPDFAIPSLQALLNSSHHVCAVYTKPDTPSGRGQKLTASPVKTLMTQSYPNIPVLQPSTLKETSEQRKLSEFNPDVMIVIAYGLILPKEIISIPKYGCINVHASLLPRWRGAAPIHRAILAGDSLTGVTIMQIDEGLDTGDILHHLSYSIKPTDTTEAVHDHLATMGATALLTILEKIESDELHPVPQDNSLATYAAKVTKQESIIDWSHSAAQIDRQIRAFNPWPVAYTFLGTQMLKIWQAEIISTRQQSNYVPGMIVATSEKGIDVATEEGVLRITTVQLSGGKPMSAKAFLTARDHLLILGETILGN